MQGMLHAMNRKARAAHDTIEQVNPTFKAKRPDETG